MTTEILKKFAYFFMKIGSTFDGSVFGHPVRIITAKKNCKIQQWLWTDQINKKSEYTKQIFRRNKQLDRNWTLHLIFVAKCSIFPWIQFNGFFVKSISRIFYYFSDFLVKIISRIFLEFNDFFLLLFKNNSTNIFQDFSVNSLISFVSTYINFTIFFSFFNSLFFHYFCVKVALYVHK